MFRRIWLLMVASPSKAVRGDNMWAALLGFGVVVALFTSLPLKRARYWVLLIAAGYFIPRYWDIAGFGKIYMLNLIMDATICLIIDRYAQKAWEVRLFNVFRGSAATSVLFCAGHILLSYFSTPSTFMGYYFEAYGMLLEAFNWTALAIITLEGWPETHGRLTAAFRGRPHRQTARATLRAPRASNSWQRR